MIFVEPLPATLANVRCRWLAGGVLGSIQSSGITQVGTFLLWRIDSTVPANAEELIIYDNTDLTNYTLARKAWLIDAAISSVTAPTAQANADAVLDELLSLHQIPGSVGATLSESSANNSANTVSIKSIESQTGQSETSILSNNGWQKSTGGYWFDGVSKKVFFQSHAIQIQSLRSKLAA